MKLKNLFPILLAYMLAAVLPAAGQPVSGAGGGLRFSMQHYTDESGLPQNSVTHLTIDNAGFLWFATSAGLVRFDGRNFRVWNEHVDIRHFIHNRVSGKMYVFFRSGDLMAVDSGSTHSVGRMAFPDRAYLPRSPWLSHFRGQVLPYAFDGLDYSYIIPTAGRRYYSLLADTLLGYEGTTRTFRTVFSRETVEPWRFFVCGEKLYYLNEKGGLREFGENAHTIVPRGDLARNRNYGRSGTEIRPLSNPASGETFIYLENALYLVETDSAGELDTRLILTGFDFSDHAISTICYDREHGRVFLGSYTDGLFVFSRQRFMALTYDEFVSEKFGNSYSAQVPYGDNRVLTSEGSVLGMDGGNRYLDGFSEYADRVSLARDAEGNIWSKRIFELHRWDKSATRLMHSWGFTRVISVIHADADSSLWVGTQNPGGLYRMSINRPAALPVRVANRLPDVTFILQASPDMLCLGTVSGVYTFDVRTNVLRALEGFSGKSIRSMYLYPQRPDELWVITENAGMFLYKWGKAHPLPADRENFLADARCMLRDSSGYFWISTGKGLFSVCSKDLVNYVDKKNDRVYYFHYGKSNGFNSNEFNGDCQPCGLHLQNGYFSFPSLNGLVWFNPGNVQPEYPSAPMYIDRVEVDGESYTPSDTLRLARNFKDLSIHYTTPYFGSRGNLNFESKLDNGEWKPASVDHMAFNSLPTGTHELYIRKLNGPGMANYSVKKIVLIIPPAFWQTAWFIALCILFIVGVIYLYTRLRVLYMQRKNELLEEAITERTQELKQTIQALKESKEIIGRDAELQKRLTATIAHDVKTPLKYLLLTTGSLSKTPPEQLGAEHETIKTVYSSLYRIFHFTDNLLAYIKSRFNDATDAETEAIHLKDVMQEKIDIFRDIAKSQSTVIENRVGEHVVIKCNRNLLSVVIHNLIDNAVKFTFNGTIRCEARRKESEIQISIIDTGVGIHPEQMESIQLFFESEDLKWDPGYNKHNGLGLVIIKEIVKQMGGRIIMDSEKGEGTTVIVYLPIT